jgi:hypothetical protein
VERLTARTVRPWKLPSAATSSPPPSGIPRRSWPWRRIAFTAVSTASAPVFMGSARSAPVTAQSRARKGPIRSLRKAREVRVRRPACSTRAATMRGCRWPWFRAE